LLVGETGVIHRCWWQF